MLRKLFILSSIILHSVLNAQGLDSSENIEKIILEVLDESQGSDNLNDENISENINTLTVQR